MKTMEVPLLVGGSGLKIGLPGALDGVQHISHHMSHTAEHRHWKESDCAGFTTETRSSKGRNMGGTYLLVHSHARFWANLPLQETAGASPIKDYACSIRDGSRLSSRKLKSSPTHSRASKAGGRPTKLMSDFDNDDLPLNRSQIVELLLLAIKTLIKPENQERLREQLRIEEKTKQKQPQWISNPPPTAAHRPRETAKSPQIVFTEADAIEAERSPHKMPTDGIGTIVKDAQKQYLLWSPSFTLADAAHITKQTAKLWSLGGREPLMSSKITFETADAGEAEIQKSQLAPNDESHIIDANRYLIRSLSASTKDMHVRKHNQILHSSTENIERMRGLEPVRAFPRIVQKPYTVDAEELNSHQEPTDESDTIAVEEMEKRYLNPSPPFTLADNVHISEQTTSPRSTAQRLAHVEPAKSSRRIMKRPAAFEAASQNSHQAPTESFEKEKQHLMPSPSTSTEAEHITQRSKALHSTAQTCEEKQPGPLTLTGPEYIKERSKTFNERSKTFNEIPEEVDIVERGVNTSLTDIRRLKVLDVHAYVHNALREKSLRQWLMSREIEE